MPLTAVQLIDSPERWFACVRVRLPVADVPARCREFLDQVYAAGKAGKVELDGQNIFTYRPTDSEGIVDAEFGVGVRQVFSAIGNVVPAVLPRRTAATTTLTGDYSGIRSGHGAIIDWCKANGKRRSGVRWEIYGHWIDDITRVETHIFHEVVG